MRWLPLFVLASLLAPAPARAWTDASVSSARATLTIDEHAHAHVIVEVTLRVDGGWLEGFELDGLDPDLVLDSADPVTLVRAVSPDGEPAVPSRVSEAFAPGVEVIEGGRVALSFPRRGAPRRGDYLVHVAYDTVLAGRATTASADGLTVRWTFPAWRYGLDSVEVVILAPAGTTALAPEDEEIGVDRAEDLAGARITLTRAHLARTRAWPIEILVPLASVDPALAILPARPTATALVSPVSPPRPWHGAALLSLACALVALRISRAHARTTHSRSVEHPLVPMTASWRARGVLGLGLILVLFDRLDSPVPLGLAALGVASFAASRRSASVLPPRLGSFRHATRTLLGAARRARLVRAIGLDAWLDATTVPGLVSVIAFASVVITQVPREALGSALLALALVLHAFLVDARANGPEAALVTLGRLVRLAERTRVSLTGPALAFLPVIHLGVGGEAHEARLRVIGQLDADVLRTDVVVIGRGLFGARHGLLVVARREGPADLALANLTSFREVSRGSERVARVLPIRGDRIDEAFTALAEALETCVPEVEVRRASAA